MGGKAALAVVSAVLLAFVPRLPSVESSGGIGLASSGNSIRISSGASRRLRIFAGYPDCGFLHVAGRRQRFLSRL